MIRFVDILGRTLPGNRIQEICQAMLLSEDESYLFLERFCSMKTIEQCDRVSPQRQRLLVPILNDKVQLWFDSNNEEFFTEKELRAVYKSLQKHRLGLP